MEIQPFDTIAEEEAEAAKDLPDLWVMPLSELVAFVLKNDPNFADNQSEEAVFIAACGDEENGLKAHKKYRTCRICPRLTRRVFSISSAGRGIFYAPRGGVCR